MRCGRCSGWSRRSARRYAASPAWLKALMDAWADGLNYYLHENPQVKPRVITRFEPWMPLGFTCGFSCR